MNHHILTAWKATIFDMTAILAELEAGRDWDANCVKLLALVGAGTIPTWRDVNPSDHHRRTALRQLSGAIERMANTVNKGRHPHYDDTLQAMRIAQELRTLY